ncbi:MAG: hypothetical protein EB075_14055, partial [Bacteroidetes bacterium]|nr:hypothetical protein [Bacteroidota bacterium]
TTESGDQKHVVTAKLSNGNYVAVWSSDEGGADFFDQRTYGQIFKEDGTKVGSEFVVAYQASAPDVTALSDGTFVVALSVGLYEQAFVATKYNNDGSVVIGYESPKTLFDPYSAARQAELIETQRGELVGFFSLHSTPQDNLPGGSDWWEVVARRYDSELNPIGDLVHVNTSVWGNQWIPGNGNITQTINGDLVFVWASPVQSAGGAAQAKLRVFDQDLTARTGEIDLIPSPTLGWANTAVASLGGGGVAAAYSLDDGIGVKLLDASYNVVHSFSLSSGGNTFLTKLQREIVLTQVDEETFALTWFEEYPDQANGQLIDVKTQVFGNDGTPMGEARIVGQTGVGADRLDVEVSNGSLGISFSQVPSASDESVNGDGDGSGLFFERVSLVQDQTADLFDYTAPSNLVQYGNYPDVVQLADGSYFAAWTTTP